MIRVEYVHDNSKSRQVFERLIYGLKDSDGSYVQPGMPDTLMFDKRMLTVPYKENGSIFKITSTDDPSSRNYFLILTNVVGRFQNGEKLKISDTVNYTDPDVISTVLNSKIDALSVTSGSVVLNAVTNFTVAGSVSNATGTIQSCSVGSSLYHPHTLRIVPTGDSHPETQHTYTKNFTPTKDVTYLNGIKLSKGWNFVSIQNDTTGENYEIIVNCRYYATVTQSVADEIYKWVNEPIDRERANIYHYLSTRLCEMYLSFQELMPSIDIIQKLGSILSVKSLISNPGSASSIREITTALSGNTPFVSRQENQPFINPAIFHLYNQAQDKAGVNLKIWLRNKQMVRWLSFLKYIDNVPFYQLNSVSEHEISLNRVFPTFCYNIPIQILPIHYCRVCGYHSYTNFDICPECSSTCIKQIVNTFVEKETVTFNGRVTGVVVKQYENCLLVTGLTDVINDSFIETIVVGSQSNTQATIKDIATEYHDWNTPVVDLTTVKKLEWHYFNFDQESLNDDWKNINCFSSVVGFISSLCTIRFAVCAGFWPWDTIIKEPLSYEPATALEEYLYRTHQFDIDKYWDDSTSAIITEFNSLTFSNFHKYQTNKISTTVSSKVYDTFLTRDGTYITLRPGDKFVTDQDLTKKLGRISDTTFVINYQKDGSTSYLVIPESYLIQGTLKDNIFQEI